MLELRKLNKKKMNLEDALKYIDENSPNKKSKEEVKDLYNNENKHVGRVYTVTDKEEVVNEFTMLVEDDKVYLTHEFKNPNTELLLDDEDIY